MSSTVGVDLSSKAIDLVKLDEDSGMVDWRHVALSGADSWARTLDVRDGSVFGGGSWFDDVYLVAIEAPYGRGQPGTSAILNRVVGAVSASLPAHLRAPERCWLVRPDEWKGSFGMVDKPSRVDLVRLGFTEAAHGSGWFDDQNARDAACLALFARDAIRSAATVRDG